MMTTLPRTRTHTHARTRALAGVALAAVLAACAGTVEETAEAEAVVAGDMAVAAPFAPLPPMRATLAEQAPMALTGAVAPSMPAPQPAPGSIDRDEYEDVDLNPVKLVSEEPVSTFSIDTDTASYANVRRFLNDGVAPPSDAVRVEELVNYFDYAYPAPGRGDAPFSVTTRVAPAPWNADAQVLHIGLKGYEIVPDQRPAANLVFLLDVSGSMNAPDKLPLLKKSVRLLVNELTADDTVSIVVYAGAAGQVLEPTPGNETGKILAALDQLSAGGSTAGGEGLRLAYALAEANFDPDAVNRVILATDGDFNVGVTSDQRLEDFIADKRETGVYLSIFGFGRGNYNDALMQTLAQAGDGTAAYIDTLNEARKVLKDEMTSTLFPIADDVKIQVEFNPARVAEYRLIGYETRALRREDFSNDAVDAGEIGAGHEVTAIYEIIAPDSPGRRIEESRYAAPATPSAVSDELAFVRVRYKEPGGDTSKLIERPVTDADAVSTLANADRETRFALAVAGYGQLLQRSPYMADYDFADVIALGSGAKGEDAFGYRAEFIQLARLAETAASMEALERPGAGE